MCLSTEKATSAVFWAEVSIVALLGPSGLSQIKQWVRGGLKLAYFASRISAQMWEVCLARLVKLCGSKNGGLLFLLNNVSE